jgi:hypothetical protein
MDCAYWSPAQKVSAWLLGSTSGNWAVASSVWMTADSLPERNDEARAVLWCLCSLPHLRPWTARCDVSKINWLHTRQCCGDGMPRHDWELAYIFTSGFVSSEQPDEKHRRRRWEESIKTDLTETGCEVMTGFSWLRTGSNGGTLWTRQWIRVFAFVDDTLLLSNYQLLTIHSAA